MYVRNKIVGYLGSSFGHLWLFRKCCVGFVGFELKEKQGGGGAGGVFCELEGLSSSSGFDRRLVVLD